MKWALLSDIHANIQALQACEAHARRQGVERLAVLGDLVGYGGDPLPVVERVMQWHADGACVLQGNHDAMAVTPPQAEGSLGAVTAAWTYQQLPPHCRRFLAQLPLTQRVKNTEDGVRLGVGNAVSSIVWLTVAIYWLRNLCYRAEGLQTMVMPVAAVCTLLPALLTGFACARARLGGPPQGACPA